MVIKASASAEIRTLVEALDADDEVQREAAIARLGIIGARAVDRLTDAYANTARRATRLAILRALEGIGDHRSAPLARQALGEGGDVAVAATGILRRPSVLDELDGRRGALDTLVATTLDRQPRPPAPAGRVRRAPGTARRCADARRRRVARSILAAD